jgi:hypothetical protein
MNYYNEERKTPILGEYDVIVAGGGPAGFGAAVAAGRSGAKTLLIERFNCLGGMWTSGLVNPLFDYENKGGIVQELVDRINSLGMNTLSGPEMYTFDFETMKLLLDRMVLGAGVKMLLHTFIVDVVMEGDTICGVIVENKGGRGVYKAKIVIDCTGDGDVAARAGAPWNMGRPEDGKTQPMTLMFKIGNLDYVQTYPNPIRPKEYGTGSGTELFDLMDISIKQKGVKDYEWNFIQPCILRLPGQHIGVMQMTHMRGKSGLDPNELTEAEIEGRERVATAMADLKKYLQGFEHSQLEQTAAMIGVRETRRIKGLYELTQEDLGKGARFDDGFCICHFGVDIHQPDKNSQENDRVFHMKPYHIPYRSLVPLKVKNLLVAGRCISGDFIAHASYRVTGDCAAMGQAAGTAAGLCLEDKKAPHELDGKLVVKKMVADGAKR